MNENHLTLNLELCFLIWSLLLLFLLLYYQRPKLPEEIEEEKREWESLKETLPLLEITLTTNEKIKGKFLEGDEYFEEVETENKYYKTSIAKIEIVKD